MPNSICLASFRQCREENPGSEDCPKCGTRNPEDVPEGVISSTVVSSATATSTEAPASTAAALSATETPGAAAPLGRVPGVGGFAVGVVAALGVFL